MWKFFYYNYQQRSLSLVHVHALGPCVGFNPNPLSPPSLSLASHSHYLPFPFPPLRLFWYHHSLLILYAREEYRQTDREQIRSCHRLIIIMILWIIVERFDLLQHSTPVKGSSLSLLFCFVLHTFFLSPLNCMRGREDIFFYDVLFRMLNGSNRELKFKHSNKWLKSCGHSLN